MTTEAVVATLGRSYRSLRFPLAAACPFTVPSELQTGVVADEEASPALSGVRLVNGQLYEQAQEQGVVDLSVQGRVHNLWKSYELVLSSFHGSGVAKTSGIVRDRTANHCHCLASP